MNIVIDTRLQTDEGCLELLMLIALETDTKEYYVDCGKDIEHDEVVAGVYAKCVDHRADLFIGVDSVAKAIRELGINAVSLNVGEV